MGDEVRDTGSEGLDSIREVRDIADAIIEDCVAGRISYRQAMSRMNLLELVAAKSFASGKEQRARQVVDEKRRELMEQCK